MEVGHGCAQVVLVRFDQLTDLVDRRPWVTRPFPDLAQSSSDATGALDHMGYTGAEDGEPREGPVWQWSCLTHARVRAPEQGACPRCGKRMFPVVDE